MLVDPKSVKRLDLTVLFYAFGLCTRKIDEIEPWFSPKLMSLLQLQWRHSMSMCALQRFPFSGPLHKKILTSQKFFLSAKILRLEVSANAS